MSMLMAILRRWWIVLWVGKEPVRWTVAGTRTVHRDPDRASALRSPFDAPLADRSLGLCDACGVAWGVEIWLHPDQLLVTVLCLHHSTDQAVALQERDWSRLIQPTDEACFTTALATRTTRG